MGRAAAGPGGELRTCARSIAETEVGGAESGIGGSDEGDHLGSERMAGGRLGMGPAASVSQYVRQHRLAGGTTTRRFKAALSRVNT